jgi:hypothetical protein
MAWTYSNATLYRTTDFVLALLFLQLSLPPNALLLSPALCYALLLPKRAVINRINKMYKKKKKRKKDDKGSHLLTATLVLSPPLSLRFTLLLLSLTASAFQVLLQVDESSMIRERSIEHLLTSQSASLFVGNTRKTLCLSTSNASLQMSVSQGGSSINSTEMM